MTATEVLLLGGRSGVGKSAAALELFRRLAAADVMVCLIEGDNLDLAHPSPWRQGHDLAEKNLAEMWRNYRAIGHTRLIYVNTASVLPETMRSLTVAMGGDPGVHGVLLTASDATVGQRLAQREVGGGLDEHLERSRSLSGVLDAAAPAEVHRFATDGRTVGEVAAQVERLLPWAP